MKYRKLAASLFFGTMIPLIYYFIQHKVHQVAGGETFRMIANTANKTKLTQFMPFSSGP